ncbi:50S ribosomal protein L3 [Patescibacteria group bacterium]|nr:50S ribosomal protein L3 [Patescibacteria group bacterium]
MKFILGTKEHMTQVWNEDGRVFPATIISAGPVKVVQIKDVKKDGYAATQVGYGTKKEKNVNKAQRKGGLFRFLREFRGDTQYKVGDKIDISSFSVGDIVEVSAISKGKGFQGGVKRHGFAGGPRTHGNKHHERAPGSIGATGPQRVFKGVRMAGRMGNERVTVKNLKILQIDQEENKMLISGAIPGHRGTLIEIRSI